MDCPLCARRFGQPRKAIVFFCGHTCCDVCAEKAPKCPVCDQEISGRADNIVVQQAAERRICEHENKALFCPLCCLAICIDCLVGHSYHGVLRLEDEQVEAIIRARGREERDRLTCEKSLLEERLEEVSQQHYQVSEVWRDLQERTKEAFAVLHELLIRRETEITETLRETVLPITSRLLAISSELSSSLDSVNSALSTLENAQFSPLTDAFPSIIVQFPDPKLAVLPFSTEKWRLTLDLSPVYTAILSFGHFSQASESPSSSFINDSFLRG